MALFGGIILPGKPDLENARKLDRLPIPMIRKMQRYGIAFDIEGADRLTHEVINPEIARLEKEIKDFVPRDKLGMFMGEAGEIVEGWDDDGNFNVNSSEQLAGLLFKHLGLGKGQKLKKTAEGQYSTGKKQLESIKNEHPIIALILKYKEYVKVKNTYATKLPKVARFHPRNHDGSCPVCELPHVESTWRVHSEYTTTRAVTGRLASKNKNLQNITARTKLGRMIRELFYAPRGYKLVGNDFGQVELRDLAHMSMDANLIRIFRLKKDPHTDTAMRAFKMSKEQVESDEGKLLYRAPCKNVNFGIVYGLMAAGLLDQMRLTYATAGLAVPEWLTLEWCEEFIDLWFSLYPGVLRYMELQQYRVKRYGCVWDAFGCVRQVPEWQSVHKWIKNAGMRQAGNMPIQGTSAGQTKIAMGESDLEITERLMGSGIWCWPLLSIHDELKFEVDENWADWAQEELTGVMKRVMVDRKTGENLWRVEIESDGNVKDRWVK